MENEDQSWASNRGDWIQTFSGRAFYPLDPQPEDIVIGDIAHALSLQCRFTGHTRASYSVAQHSINVATVIELKGGSPSEALWGLMHDASEAYLVDVARPVKHTPEMSPYRAAEKRVMAAVCKRFDLPLQEPPIVKMSDNILLAVEAHTLMAPLRRPGWEYWDRFLEQVPDGGVRIEIDVPWRTVRQAFMATFERLGGHYA